jgi:formiminoglutamase
MMIPHTSPARWPAGIPRSRFAATIRRDSPRDCTLALLGIPDDTGVRLNHGRPGAAQGPDAFRAALARYGAAQPAGEPWPRVFDAGNVVASPTLDETHARVTTATAALLESGLLPVAIGGGHDHTFPLVRAVAQEFGPMTGVYFDAHLDVRETEGSGMAFRRLVECGHARALHVYGFRPFVNSREHHAWFIAHGGHAHVDSASGAGLASKSRAPFAAPAAAIAATLPETGELMFTSFDLDVLDMAYAPGVSAPNPAGWSPAEAERWVLACGLDPRVRCFDLMELCPPHDEGGRTARLAAHLFLVFLAGVAARAPARSG